MTHYGAEIGHLTPLLRDLPAGRHDMDLLFPDSGFVIFVSLTRTRSAMDFVLS